MRSTMYIDSIENTVIKLMGKCEIKEGKPDYRLLENDNVISLQILQ